MNRVSIILDEVRRARIDEPVNKEIYSNLHSQKNNEFLFILKPEVFALLSREESQSVLELVFDRMAQFDISLNSIRVLNASYLDANKVMAQHYGVINAAASNFQNCVTNEIKTNFYQFYDQQISDVQIFGALELYEVFPEISEEDLQQLWSKVDIKRLAGGVYAGKVNYKGIELYIINGFHPPQLQHFIAKNRVIVTMNLSGNIHWKEARNLFIGNTYPEKANAGTLRRDLYDKYGKFGFDAASYVINCVHLSAGPLEGLLELQRFNSNPGNSEEQNNAKSRLADFGFGRTLAKEFSNDILEKIVANPLVRYEGKEISLFDLTEEMNSIPALEAIRKSLTENKL